MFIDRTDAGRQLALALTPYANERPVVIGLPRGGIPVASEVARHLRSPLDIVVVRKLGTPGNAELGFGALSEEDVIVFNQDLIKSLGLQQSEIERTIAHERVELTRRLQGIRSRFPQLDLKDRTVIVVDDGIATGIDARAACRVVRARGASKLVLAVPVAPSDWRFRLQREADDLVAIDEDPGFMAVGAYYSDFTQVTDEQVLECLESACLTH